MSTRRVVSGFAVGLLVVLGCGSAAEPAATPASVPTSPPAETASAVPNGAASGTALTSELQPYFDDTYRVSSSPASLQKCKGGNAQECFAVGAQWESGRFTNGKSGSERLAQAESAYKLGCIALERTECTPAERANGKRNALTALMSKGRDARMCAYAVDGMQHLEPVDAHRAFDDECMTLLAPKCVEATRAIAAAEPERQLAMLAVGCGEELYCKRLKAEPYCKLAKAARRDTVQARTAFYDLLVNALASELGTESTPEDLAAFRRGLELRFGSP